MKKNICFVMPNMSGGGAQRVISVLANWFSKNNYKTTIFLTNKNLIEYELDERIEIDYSCTEKKHGFFDQIRAIRKQMKNNPDDVFVSFLNNQNIITVLAGLLMPNKVIISQRCDPNNSFPDCKNKLVQKILRQISKMIYVLADKAVFQTQDAMDYYPKCARQKYQIIMNPLSDNIPDRFEGNRTKRVVTVGRLNFQKNLTLAIDAFKAFNEKYPEYIFEIYGKGELEDKLKEYVKSLQLENKVIFKGFCDDVYSKILDAGMFIITSDFEGMSNAMIEAMALGVPTISTDCPVGGARMVIEDGFNGFLVPVRDEKKLVSAMIKIAESEALQEQFSENGSKIKDKLAVETICNEWKNLISCL